MGIAAAQMRIGSQRTPTWDTLAKIIKGLTIHLYQASMAMIDAAMLPL